MSTSVLVVTSGQGLVSDWMKSDMAEFTTMYPDTEHR